MGGVPRCPGGALLCCGVCSCAHADAPASCSVWLGLGFSSCRPPHGIAGCLAPARLPPPLSPPLPSSPALPPPACRLFGGDAVGAQAPLPPAGQGAAPAGAAPQHPPRGVRGVCGGHAPHPHRRQGAQAGMDVWMSGGWGTFRAGAVTPAVHCTACSAGSHHWLARPPPARPPCHHSNAPLPPLPLPSSPCTVAPPRIHLSVFLCVCRLRSPMLTITSPSWSTWARRR